MRCRSLDLTQKLYLYISGALYLTRRFSKEEFMPDGPRWIQKAYTDAVPGGWFDSAPYPHTDKIAFHLELDENRRYTIETKFERPPGNTNELSSALAKPGSFNLAQKFWGSMIYTLSTLRHNIISSSTTKTSTLWPTTNRSRTQVSYGNFASPVVLNFCSRITRNAYWSSPFLQAARLPS
jgi:hypothetical protein